MRVAVIGAGVAGLAAAYQLAKRNAEVAVFEAGDAVGGLARSIDLWGQRVDLGPHRFFSKSARVNRLWLELAGSDYRMVERLTRIYFQGRFYDYPLRAGNALKNMGVFRAAHCVLSYMREKVKPSFPESYEPTFESWVVRKFGRQLFEMFFKSYSEKLWGIPCQELDADFAAQRIKRFSLGEAIKAALGVGKKQHKTLVDRFAYPIGGTGMVYERMADFVRAQGGQVHLKRPVRRVVMDGPRARGLEFDDGHFEPYDFVVSTMPLTLLVRGLGDGVPTAVQEAVGKLRFRNTILVYLHVDAADLFADQWQYIHSPDLLVGRVTNFRNWVPDLYGDKRATILTLEYWCFDEDAMWQEADATLIERATREMRSTGLLGNAAVTEGHVIRLRRCYPVYTRGYKRYLDPIVDYLRTLENLLPIGRYGSFKYNNQDHSILMGILAAENILDDRHHDLWAVNTDYDAYQESAIIGEKGLEQLAGAS